MRISLRYKLCLISLLLLALPYTGMRTATIVKENLLESRKQALMFSARAVASALSDRDDLFDTERFRLLDQNRDLYLFQLTNPIRLNGKIDDWHPHLEDAQKFGVEHLVAGSGNHSPKDSGFTHLIGKRGKYIYALFIVNDKSRVYRQPQSIALDRSDHLRIAIEDNSGKRSTYFITAEKAGWVNGFLMIQYGDRLVPKKTENRIQGVWRENDNGYTLEIRITEDMLGKRLAFAIGDVDDATTRTIDTIIGTAKLDQPADMGWLLSQSPRLGKLLESLNRPQSRIQIIDSNQHIRASYGNLDEGPHFSEQQQSTPPLLAKLYNFFRPVFLLFTEPFGTAATQQVIQPTELNLEGVKDALLGESSITGYKLQKEDVEVMAAITPLYDHDTIIGAVVVEQTTNSILALKNRVIEESVFLTLLIMLFGGFGLFFFAFRLSSRIRHLRDQTALSISPNGQILEIAPPSSSTDEIGDLSRTLHTILFQLKAQGQYREKMADNLEHEMRTPLASVSASLKNLENELSGQPHEIQNYVSWALRDINRMEDMLSTIRDATSLEAALDRGMKETFDLSQALAMWLTHSWEKAFPEVTFELNNSKQPVNVHGDPDKILQMLDKLIENSVAFHTYETPITLVLKKTKSFLTLQVRNYGPHIPGNMLEEIFNSMISSREKQDKKPHLGLGLYIVRTIALHHGGSVRAENFSDQGTGVCLSVRLPLAA